MLEHILAELSLKPPAPASRDLFCAAAKQRTTPPRVRFVYPARTKAIRLGPAQCGLNCAHCGGFYLRSMQPWQPDIEADSLLVSGGCDSSGRVQLTAAAALRRWKERPGRRLNIHTGLAGPEEQSLLRGLADVISFDFVYDRETIRTVYGLAACPEDYLRTYDELRRIAPVVPHICIGLLGGRLKGEREALRCLAEAGIEALTFLVFIPTPGTAFTHCQPPPLLAAAELLAEARLMLPDIHLSLGCMRPKGRYRLALDALALAVGIDSIVHPTPLARKLAREQRFVIEHAEECCSL